MSLHLNFLLFFLFNSTVKRYSMRASFVTSLVGIVRLFETMNTPKPPLVSFFPLTTRSSPHRHPLLRYPPSNRHTVLADTFSACEELPIELMACGREELWAVGKGARWPPFRFSWAERQRDDVVPPHKGSLNSFPVRYIERSSLLYSNIDICVPFVLSCS